MQYRQLGSSDLQMPVVTFGAWTIGGWLWGWVRDDEEAIRAMQKAMDLGITAIDTAAVYGMGHSEKLVGQAIKGRRDEVIIATKCGVRWDIEEGRHVFDSNLSDGTPVEIHRFLGAESIKQECEQSLKRLGVDVIDLYQCHQPDMTTPVEETIEAMLQLQQEGKIRHIGMSNFPVELMQECLAAGAIVSDQPMYNPLQRDIEKDIVPFCVENNLGLLVYSPMARGLMTGKVTMDREFPEGDNRLTQPWFKPENRQRVLDMLKKIRPIADGHNATLAQLTVNWVISQKGITAALVGARNEQQVEENARAADFQLTDEELAIIRTAVEELGDPV